MNPSQLISFLQSLYFFTYLYISNSASWIAWWVKIRYEDKSRLTCWFLGRLENKEVSTSSVILIKNLRGKQLTWWKWGPNISFRTSYVTSADFKTISIPTISKLLFRMGVGIGRNSKSVCKSLEIGIVCPLPYFLGIAFEAWISFDFEFFCFLVWNKRILWDRS